MGYITLPVLASCQPSTIPLQAEQQTTPIGPDGTVSVDVSSLTQATPALVAPNVVGQDGYGVIVTMSPDGTIHAFSMRCTHQACSVDNQPFPYQGHEDIHCSCHGSVFALDGSVVIGPATEPLTPYTVTYNASQHIAKIKII